MAEVKFNFVDFATDKSPAGKPVAMDPISRKEKLKKACEIISSIVPVKPKEFNPGKKNPHGKHLLLMLANNQPVSALYFVASRNLDGRKYITFHHHNAAKKEITLQYARKHGKTPARALFKWMKMIAGNKAIVFSRATDQGRRFLKKLERDGFLKRIKKGKISEYAFTGKPLKRLKRHAVR